MFRGLLALMLMVLAAPGLSGCQPLRRLRGKSLRRSAVATSRTAPTGRYTAQAPGGPALRVCAGHYLVGALRRTDADIASAPWPASPLVAAAEMDDGWRFAAADGSLFYASRFTAALRLIGALPTRAPAVSLEDRLRSAHGVYSRGALVVIDDAEGAWLIGVDNTPRALPGVGFLSGAMRDAAVGLFVRTPGMALLTRDGGRTLQPLPLPEGAVAYAAALVDNTLRLDSAAGPMRLDDAYTLVPDPDAAPMGLWLPARTPNDPSHHAHDEGPVLPRDATQAAMMSPRRLGVIRHEQLDVIDAQTGLVLDHFALPGSACTLATSGEGLRAVCTHQGWARAVFALHSTGRWEVLRDERRGEALGEIAFDDASPAWAVAAACARSTEIDPTRLCLYDGRGGQQELHLPFDGGPVAFHDGVLLVAEAARSEGLTRAARIHHGRIEPLTLPLRGDDARTLRLHNDTLSGWVRRDEAPAAFARGRLGTEALRDWSLLDAPVSMRQGIAGPDDLALSLGDTAAALLWQRGTRSFSPLPSPVDGHPATLELIDTASAYCVGPRCRLGEGLEWTLAVAPAPAPFVARHDAPPPRPAPLPEPDAPRCHRGSALGAAAQGTLHWQQAPDALHVVWESPPRVELHAPIRPRGNGTRVVMHHAMEAPDTLGLLERCDDVGCDLVVATRAGLHRLPLPDGLMARHSDIEALDEARLLVRVALSGEGFSSTRAWLLNPRSGAVLDAAEVVHRAAPEAVFSGLLDDRAGLWVPASPGQLRFVNLSDHRPPPSGEEVHRTWPAPHRQTPLCAMQEEALGVLLRPAMVSLHGGDSGSGSALPWHLLARYRLTRAGFCLLGYAGQRDEEAPAERSDGLVRFAVTAEHGALIGEGHSASARHALRCTP